MLNYIDEIEMRNIFSADGGWYWMTINRTLLIVDDNVVNRNILRNILKSEYEILEAENGKEALDLLRKNTEQIALVLLDIVMPEMDGYSFLSVVSKDQQLSTIPIIVTTKFNREEDEIKALSQGAADFVTKPYKPGIVRHKVQSIIRLHENAAMVNLLKYDSLTGVYTPGYLYREIRNVLDKHPSKRYDIICCDIANFKFIKDVFGKTFADTLLCNLARALKKWRGETILIGRVGQDDFAQLVPHQNDYNSQMFADFVDELNRTLMVTYKVELNFGIYVIQDRNVPVEVMCDRASLALENIKTVYHQYYVYYDDSIRRKMFLRQEICGKMESALKEEQFHVYLQPKHNITTGSIVGMEALVRWIDPEYGTIQPGTFIPIFERNGFITKLDHYVWEKAFLLQREWLNRGFEPIPVSVNISRIDLFDPSLPQYIMNLAQKYQVDPKYFHLEITESAYADNARLIIQSVNRLREYGFIIEMDDFGTGYSSLNMLGEMPLDVIKLDMRFIQGKAETFKRRAIMEAIVLLTKKLNLKIIAEGVETQEQLEFLRDINCDNAQGYFYSKPLPVHQFTTYLKKCLSIPQ